jgi:hypothetical protein
LERKEIFVKFTGEMVAKVSRVQELARGPEQVKGSSTIHSATPPVVLTAATALKDHAVPSEMLKVQEPLASLTEADTTSPGLRG